jgi:hypothetical protein
MSWLANQIDTIPAMIWNNSFLNLAAML